MAASSTTKVLRPAREAVMYALKNWQHWTVKPNVYDSDELMQWLSKAEPQLSRMPVVSARWREYTPEWWVFNAQQWRAPLEVSIWVPRDRHSLAEDLVEDAIDAVFRYESESSTDANPVSYVLTEKLDGCNAEIVSISPAVPAELGEGGLHQAWLSTVVFSLRVNKSPRLRGT